MKDKLKLLMDQAPPTIDHYMSAAVKHIDQMFGSGYAGRHPELLGHFLTACAIDFQAAVLHNTLNKIDDTLLYIKDELTLKGQG